MKYRRVNSFKIKTDYEKTAKNLLYLSKMADAKDSRFFRINKDKIESNILQSKMSNQEKNTVLMMINKKDYHQIYCYCSILYEKYNKIALEYDRRMSQLFMTVEEKTLFYA